MKRLLSLLVILILVWPTPATAAQMRPMPSQLYGWTTDNGYATTRLVDTAKRMSRMSTVRVVFDEFVKARDYAPTVKALQPHAYIMGELLDSEYIPQYSTQAYLNRTTEYLNAMGSLVDVWEVGNEVNGEWAGITSSVVAKISGAYDLVRGRGLRTALTLYQNEGCWERSANQMLPWAQKNIPARMKQGLDYVFVSYYEHDCNGRRLTQAQWRDVFDQLHAMFPYAKLGFGEVGTAKNASFEKKREVMTYYYTLDIDTENYVGFHGWWYGYQDLTPYTKPLFGVFNQLIKSN